MFNVAIIHAFKVDSYVFLCFNTPVKLFFILSSSYLLLFYRKSNIYMYLICAFKVDFCFFEDLCLCVCVKKTFIHRKYTNGQQTSVILVIDKY